MRFSLNTPTSLSTSGCRPHKPTKSLLQVNPSLTKQVKKLNYLLNIPYHPPKAYLRASK